MVDRLKPMTPAWHARQRRWHHNSFHGHAAMMQQNCRSIIDSTTATDESKGLARQIARLADALRASLKIRRTTP